jgi:hypothetical protein
LGGWHSTSYDSEQQGANSEVFTHSCRYVSISGLANRGFSSNSVM